MRGTQGECRLQVIQEHTFQYLKSAGEHRKHIHPPLGLLLACGLDKCDTIRSSDGKRELVTCHLLRAAHLQHTIHVHHTLGDGGWLWGGEMTRWLASAGGWKRWRDGVHKWGLETGKKKMVIKEMVNLCGRKMGRGKAVRWVIWEMSKRGKYDSKKEREVVVR